MAKIAAIAVAAIAVLSEFGYPVTSLVAGLGIGGIALALAAQKTVENLFGSLSIGIDQPFRVGDYINVDTISGTVESIGLRSTRIRTLDRTLVTLPNGKLADMRVESFAERDRIRFICVLALTRSTKAAAVREVLDGARTLGVYVRATGQAGLCPTTRARAVAASVGYAVRPAVLRRAFLPGVDNYWGWTRWPGQASLPPLTVPAMPADLREWSWLIDAERVKTCEVDCGRDIQDASDRTSFRADALF